MAINKKKLSRTDKIAEVISQAEALLRSGKSDQAESLFLNGLDQQPDNFDRLRLLGVASQFQRKYEEAVGYFSKSIALEPT